MRDEVQDKVSFAMVQSMIGQANDDKSMGGGLMPHKSTGGPDSAAFGASNRLSNHARSNTQSKNVPQVDIEESAGRQTEEFGMYSVEDDKNDGSGHIAKLGYENRIEESGLDASANKQRAAINIRESATPIHIS